MTPIEAVQRAPLGPIARNIAEHLAERFECWTTSAALVRAAYDDRIDGGPDDAENVIKAHVHTIRRRLAPLGLGVEGKPYYGRRMVRIA